MGRISNTAPQDSIVAVKPDAGEPVYVFYVQKVTRVGTARFTGSKKIVTEDGATFINLDDAGLYLARAAGLAPAEFATSRKATGRDILAAGTWYAFCAERKLDIGALGNLHEVYTLSPDEVVRFLLQPS
jgi:hypothetical protein